MLTQDSSGGVGSGGGNDPMSHTLADSGGRTLKTCSIRAGQSDSGRGRRHGASSKTMTVRKRTSSDRIDVINSVEVNLLSGLWVTMTAVPLSTF